MSFFYNLFLAIMMFLFGCASSNGSTATPDAGPINIDAKDFSADSLPSDQYIVHLKLQTPDGKPATWLVCDGSCSLGGRNWESLIQEWNENAAKWKPHSDEFRDENVSQISHDFLVCTKYEKGCFASNATGAFKLEIALIRNNYMFVEFLIETDKEMLGSQKEITPIHEWLPGTWGLAPSGHYESADGKEKDTFLTVVEKEKILVTGFGPSTPLTNYNSWSYEDESFTSNGTIADDLSSIAIDFKKKNTEQGFSGTLFHK